MKYFIKRGANEYGPYSLADLQRYVAQGNIVLADLTRSEGMTDWVPLSQVIGDIPVPVTTPAVPTAGATVYGGASPYGVATAPSMMAGPVPPDFHWALVLLIAILTCSLFGWAWLIVEAAWIRRIKPESKGLLFAVLGVSCYLVAAVTNISWSLAYHHRSPVAVLFMFGYITLVIVSGFAMRGDLEEYYTTTENINLQLDGVGSTLLTLFFPILYLQWHFSRIARWKKTGVLTPQS